MLDVETQSLWSHILGEAMRGPLRGTRLKAIPSELTTWGAWRRQHPHTTVLNLPRTYHQYKKTFYRHPEDFVYGLVVEGQAFHVEFERLMDDPIANVTANDRPLLVTLDPESTGVRLFSREVGKQALTFGRHRAEMMRDEQTGTLWSRNTGKAERGPLEGTLLQQEVGIMSYKRAWSSFHPGSRELSPAKTGSP